MAPWVKCLLCRCEDLSSNPQYPKAGVTGDYNPSQDGDRKMPRAHWRGTLANWGALGLVGLFLSQRKIKERNNMEVDRRHLTLIHHLHMYMHGLMYTYTLIHTHA